ncbi:MAG TPA: DUF1707 domain-containing protein [Streptosporangiaceae bacterium]
MNRSSFQQMRVSDAERQAVADRLGEHYSQGRLDQAEFDERVGRAMGAKTRADFDGLFDDLPEPGPTGAPGVTAGASGAPGDSRAPGAPGPTTDAPIRRRPWQARKVLTLVLIGFVALAAVHAVVWTAVPFLWLAFVIVIALAATGRLGHHRAGHGH